MPRDLVTAGEIQAAIFNRIITRQYASGHRLPSVRDLADELGANRNTVSKAYQMLAETGIIESLPGGRKGFLVREIPPQPSGGELTAYFNQQAAKLVWQALAVGMTAQETLHYLNSAVKQVYKLGDVRVAFYECNRHDSDEMGEFLSRKLGLAVQCSILDDLYADTAAAARDYDLIVTTFHHLSEVTERLKGAENIVGIDTRVTPETMLQIARLPNPRIGLVATLETTTRMLKHILYSYYPDRTIQAVTITDPEAVRAAGSECDHLVVTHTCAEQVRQITGRAPDVLVNFHVDEQSLQFLSRRIHEVRTHKTASLLASQVEGV